MRKTNRINNVAGTHLIRDATARSVLQRGCSYGVDQAVNSFGDLLFANPKKKTEQIQKQINPISRRSKLFDAQIIRRVTDEPETKNIENESETADVIKLVNKNLRRNPSVSIYTFLAPSSTGTNYGKL